MSSETFHERFEDLTPETKDLHRAISSLMEELEAVDWYQQRVDAASDDQLREILGHNRDEEIEHAMMVLEWIRRRVPKFDVNAKTYLFTKGDILNVEEATKDGADGGEEGGAEEDDNADKKAESPKAGAREVTAIKPARPADGSLGIGSLKK